MYLILKSKISTKTYKKIHLLPYSSLPPKTTPQRKLASILVAIYSIYVPNYTQNVYTVISYLPILHIIY